MRDESISDKPYPVRKIAPPERPRETPVVAIVFMTVAFCFLLACPVFLLAAWGLHWQWAAALAEGSPEPEPMTARGLIARGAGGNPHLLLSGFEVSGNYVYERDPNPGMPQQVWVPLLVLDEGDAAQFRLLLHLEVQEREAALARLERSEALEVWVQRRAVFFGAEKKQLFQKDFPATRFDELILVEPYAQVASGKEVWAALCIGAGALLGGLILAGISVVVARSLSVIPLTFRTVCIGPIRSIFGGRASAQGRPPQGQR